MSPKLLVKYDDPGAFPTLQFAKPGDAGIDLVSTIDSIVWGHDSVSVPTGVSVKIPDGYVGIIKARSSTFVKKGLFVVEGVIDSGYTGPLFTILWNPSPLEKRISRGDRLAQLLLMPVLNGPGVIQTVAELPETARGDSGFGSTGG